LGKSTPRYICNNCGTTYSRWQGKCDSCGSWNTIDAEEPPQFFGGKKPRNTIAQPLAEVIADQDDRFVTSVNEIDAVFGGGIVSGSVSLLAGAPGIGKSTLMLQLMQRFPGTVLYISGEESPNQIKKRASRLGLSGENIVLYCETNLELILDKQAELGANFLAIDSIQTIFADSADGKLSGINQLKATTSALIHLAKSKNITVVLVGHITKDGTIAGPQVLEHMVDTVIYFEATENPEIRVLRCQKNRFGPAGEIGIFKMLEKGFTEFKNKDFLYSQKYGNLPGTATSVLMEGQRPLPLEIQCLAVPSYNAYPQRTAMGIESKRLDLLLAIIDKYLAVDIGNLNVFLKLSGGFVSKDTGMDLGIIASVYSAISGKQAGKESAFIGEVGLAGEVRSFSHIDKRIEQLEKIGIKRLIGPRINQSKALKIEYLSISSVKELEKLL
jgi:DNA repair protein RadA/Sms